MKFIGVRTRRQFAIVGPTTTEVHAIEELPDLLKHYRDEVRRLRRVGASEVARAVYEERLKALEEIENAD